MSSYDIKKYWTSSALFLSYMEFLYLSENGLETISLSLSFLCFFFLSTQKKTKENKETYIKQLKQ